MGGLDVKAGGEKPGVKTRGSGIRLRFPEVFRVDDVFQPVTNLKSRLFFNQFVEPEAIYTFFL